MIKFALVGLFALLATGKEPSSSSQRAYCVSEGFPVWNGSFKNQLTICSRVDPCDRKGKEVEVYRVYLDHPEWIAISDIRAVAFIKNPRWAKILRQTDRNTDCTSTSSLGAPNGPKWLSSTNQQEVQSNLKTHCFSKTKFAGPKNTFPYIQLYKITSENRQGTKNTFRENLVGYVLPNDQKYLVLEENALKKICTCGTPGGCGGFGQPGLTGSANLTALLSNLSGK